MPRSKPIHERGKIPFTAYLQVFEEGDCVALVRNTSFKTGFPPRMQGRSGVVAGSRGTAYIVNVADLGMPKQYVIKPIHLKKIKGA